ncbi:MAG TPA: ABC transporter substrate-binding protein, partial [Acetobacteraceae bacterium]|nr:ABC transporter substrate-binding protein [Acetobacteraceae bacterium]
MTKQPDQLHRRGLLAAGGAAAGALALTAVPRTVRAAEQPQIDASFKDFTLPKFDCDDSLVRVQKKGELILTTSNDWPYSYLDSKTGAFTGLDADIITAAAKMLKIPKITVKTVSFDGMIPGLLAGRF